MHDTSYVAKTYHKLTCPFSFKFLLFMTEAGLLDQIDVVRCDPNAGDFEAIRDRLTDTTGRKASFPTVEVEPGVYMSESDDLIHYYADRNGISADDFEVLDWYKAGLFPRVIGMHREIRELKEQIEQ